MSLAHLIRQRIGSEFDGECHLSEDEALQVAAEIERLTCQLSEARKALEPFANDASIYDGQNIGDHEKSFNDNITVGDFRRARAALRDGNGGER